MNRIPGIIALLALAMTGCGTGPSGQRPEPPAPHTGSLSGRTFGAAQATVGGRPLRLLPGVEVGFGTDGRLRATGGCNQLSAPVRTDGGRIEIPENAEQTLIACAPEAARQDSRLFELLRAGPAWRLDGDRLVLTAGDTELVLTEATGADEGLAGTTWTLTGAVGADGREHTPVRPATLTFTEDTVEVHTGCNTGSAAYTATGTTIRFGALRLTRMACAEDVMRVERAVAEALSGEVRHRVEDRRLAITNPSGAGLSADGSG